MAEAGEFAPARRRYQVFNREQCDKLEKAFATAPYPDASLRDQLATELRVRASKVSGWFANRRARQRKQHAEAVKRRQDEALQHPPPPPPPPPQQQSAPEPSPAAAQDDEMPQLEPAPAAAPAQEEMPPQLTAMQLTVMQLQRFEDALELFPDGLPDLDMRYQLSIECGMSVEAVTSWFGARLEREWRQA